MKTHDLVLIFAYILAIVFVLALPSISFSSEREKFKPVSSQQVADTDRHSANLFGAAVVSGLATTALREKEYGAVKAFAGTVAAAAVIETAHAGAYNNSNVWYAVGGAAVGTIGTCTLYFRNKFVGCAMPF